MSIWMQVLFPVGPITLIKCHWQDEIRHQETPQPPFSTTPGLHYQAASSPGVGSGAQPIWPISREVRQPSPSLVLPTLSPFTKLLIAVHREMLAPFTTFTFLLGKCRNGPGTDIQTSKEILRVFVFRGGTGPGLGFRK